MWKLLYRLLFERVYVDPRGDGGGLPNYLSLREIADLPPHHPCGDRKR